MKFCIPYGIKNLIKLLLLEILLVIIYPGFSQSTDSVKYARNKQCNLISPFIVPSILIIYGISNFHGNGFPGNFRVRDFSQGHFPDFHTKIDNYTVFVPSACVFGLKCSGIKGKNSFYDAAFIYAISNLIVNSIAQPLKYSVRILRPDSTAHNSFPSGHTSSAFCAAEFMNQELRSDNILYSISAYTIASATGAMRILNNRHWFSDVLVGAGIGIISTRTAYLIYPYLKGKFKKSGKKKVLFIPVIDNKEMGFYLIF